MIIKTSEDRAMKSGRMDSLRAWTCMVALLVQGALLGWGSDVFSATLDVELDVRTRAESRGEKIPSQKDVVIFVVDRSGSMTDPVSEVGRSSEIRDDVMKEMLQNRLEMLAETCPNAEVWTISFASAISSPQGPYSPRDANNILKQLAHPHGQTLLYDAMARAVEFGEDRMKTDPDARVGLYFYTDGSNYFNGRYWVNEEVSAWNRNRQVEVKYNGPDAADRFKRDFEERIRSYAEVGKMSLETGCWLGSGDPPVMIENKRKGEFPLGLSVDGTSLKNPDTVPSQGLKARLLIPLRRTISPKFEWQKVRKILEKCFLPCHILATKVAIRYCRTNEKGTFDL